VGAEVDVVAEDVSVLLVDVPVSVPELLSVPLVFVRVAVVTDVAELVPVL
jgi:hypothetical protein